MHWFTVVFCMLLGLPAQAQTIVSGRIVGAEGQPLPAAHIEVQAHSRQASWNRISANTVAADADGRYRITVASRGPVALWFNGALHRPHQVQLLLDDQTPVTLDVQLQRKFLDTDQSFTRAVSRHQGFDYDAGAPLEEQPDGSFVAEVPVAAPGDTLVYFFEAAERSSFEGLVFEEITADRFQYTGLGKYLAEVAVPGEVARVVLRARQLDQEDPPEPVVQFGPENKRAAAYRAFYERLEAPPGLRFNAESERLGMPDETVFQEHILQIAEEIEAENDAFRRHLLMLLYLDRGLPDRFGFSRGQFIYTGSGFTTPSRLNAAMLARIRSEIPPASLLWAISPALVQVMLEQDDYAQDTVTYAEQVATAQTDPTIAAMILYNLFQGYFARQGLSEEAARYGKKFLERFPDVALADQVRAYFTSEVKVLPGRRAPSLSQSQFFDGEDMINPDTLKGKVVLLDFWSPSCTSCNTDLDVLRQVQAAYAGEGLQVLRVALDTDVARLEKASAALEPRPWWEARPAGGFISYFAQTHGVLTAPHRLLIDRDNVVLATGSALFGERLAETLRGVFRQ